MTKDKFLKGLTDYYAPNNDIAYVINQLQHIDFIDEIVVTDVSKSHHTLCVKGNGTQVTIVLKHIQ